MKKLVAILTALPLAACISLGGKPPSYYMTLTPSQPVAPNGGEVVETAHTLLVRVPITAPSVALSRIPVYESGSRITYLPGGEWNDRPAVLLQRLVAETVQARGARIVVDGRSDIRPAGILTGQLHQFGIDSANRQAVLVMDATLTSEREGIRPMTRRFSVQVPVDKITVTEANGALNQAANTMASDLADWLRTLR